MRAEAFTERETRDFGQPNRGWECGGEGACMGPMGDGGLLRRLYMLVLPAIR
jgi:hypothetical protein